MIIQFSIWRSSLRWQTSTCETLESEKESLSLCKFVSKHLLTLTCHINSAAQTSGRAEFGPGRVRAGLALHNNEACSYPSPLNK